MKTQIDIEKQEGFWDHSKAPQRFSFGNSCETWTTLRPWWQGINWKVGPKWFMSLQFWSSVSRTVVCTLASMMVRYVTTTF